MRSRLDLQDILENLLDHYGLLIERPPGSYNVYFQSPGADGMTYPCIKYQLDDIDQEHADNRPYVRTKRYIVTYIDEDPDSGVPEGLAALPMCRFNRFYTADNLNHWVFLLYY